MEWKQNPSSLPYSPPERIIKNLNRWVNKKVVNALQQAMLKTNQLS